MSTITYPDIGRVCVPKRSLSLPGRAVLSKPTDIVVATVRRPEWKLRSLFELPDVEHPYPDGRSVMERLLAPFKAALPWEMFLGQVVWASITHNERVDDGAGHNVNRCFGTVGAANAVGNFVAVANATMTKAKTDSSLDADAQGGTDNEYTTIGLSRAAGTVQNYSAPASLNGTYSVDVFKSFSVTGSGTAYGSGLFDSVTPAGSWLLVEDNFSTSASVENGDTLEITWTWTH